MSENPPRKRKYIKHSIKSLRLDLEAAEAGKTWLLLPEGFRAQECGKTYPLPSSRVELQRLVAIYIPSSKADSGCLYLKRAINEWKKRQRNRQSAIYDVGMRREKIARAQVKFTQETNRLMEQAKQAVEGVRKEAQEASASLKDLFHLSRKGLEGQMKAHLEGKEWQGEKISAKAFRDCFSMVTSAVKGLGIPSDQKVAAAEAIMEEYAAAIKATQSTLDLGPGNDDSETEH